MTTIAVATTVELLSRVFAKITGGIVSDRLNDTSLNKQAVSGLIGNKLNAELLNKAEKAQ